MSFIFWNPMILRLMRAIIETVASEKRNLEATQEIVFRNIKKLHAVDKKLYDNHNDKTGSS